MKKQFRLAAKTLMSALFMLACLVIYSPTSVSAYSTSSCYGAYAQATVCIDPTTGYGPLVYVYDANGYAIYITGVNYACTTGNYYITPKTQDTGTYVYYGAQTANQAALSNSNFYTGCPSPIRGVVQATNTQLNNIRWYSNSVNAQAVITVN